MSHFLLFFKIPLIIIGSSLIFIAAKEMSSSGISKSFLHIISGNIFRSNFDISLLISSIINLIIKLLLMFELRMFSRLIDIYTNFCLPPAMNALLWIDKSVFSLLYSCPYLNLSL